MNHYALLYSFLVKKGGVLAPFVHLHLLDTLGRLSQVFIGISCLDIFNLDFQTYANVITATCQNIILLYGLIPD